MERDATISGCGKYRYLLRRTWDRTLPTVLIIMLNPSTADADIDDATIRSCIRLTREIGYGGFEVVNIFALRATHPAELKKASDPFGPDNSRVVSCALDRHDTVIYAWGAYPMASPTFLHGRAQPSVYCFGRTKDGHPKHPLYIKSGTPLEPY